jgi:hypothetical protein
MEYTLVLGISYKKYKKSANITLHVADRFIDTFDLDKDYRSINEEILEQIDKTWYEHFERPWMLTDPFAWKDLPTFFKVYKIPKEHLQGNLKITVQNSDSDYTNGFMRNSSMVKFHVVALFPSYMTADRGKAMMKTFTDIAKRYEGIKAWTGGETVQSWPCVTNLSIKAESRLNTKSRVHVNDPIGGDVVIEIPINEKFGIKALHNAKSNQTKVIDLDDAPQGHSLLLASLTPLLNIYDEDKRSNH